MKTTGVGMGLGLGLVGLLSAPACESQVGDGYEGEVQFSLEGTVHDADSGLRPRLGFLAENEVIFVDGTVTGSFPSKFRFDVTEPAPPEAVAAGQPSSPPGSVDPYAGKLAVGLIAMMPEGAPDRLPYLEETSTDGGCMDDRCVWYETGCTASGSCRERKLECEPCELIGQKGDPALKEQAAGHTTVTTITGGYSTGIASYCTAEDSCYHEYLQCDLSDLGALEATSVSGAELCSILEESGDTSLVNPLELPTSASQYFVAYAVEAITTEFGNLVQGYNLLQLDVPTLEVMKAAPMRCESETDSVAVFCYPEFPSPRIVASSDVSINLGFPPM